LTPLIRMVDHPITVHSAPGRYPVRLSCQRKELRFD
jgi:hypothetical protein